MKVMQTYPRDAIKIGHVCPGTLIQMAHNDGTSDDAFYLVTDQGRNGSVDWIHRVVVIDVDSGELTEMNGSKRCIKFPDAAIQVSYRG
ncbi:MAG: hypothetical protein PVI97_00240 [Candidatus Thiodiazotropha sp.]|jgi:hypothetical protein